MNDDKTTEISNCLLILNRLESCYPNEKRSISEIQSYLRKLLKSDTPEGCRLVAVHDGTSWGLYVENQNEEILAILTWPKIYGDWQTSKSLAEKGFEIA